MARSKKYFNPLIFHPLQKVIVTETPGKGRMWKPHSLGYVVNIDGRPGSYKQRINIAFMRYGKGGKLRCDFNVVNHPALEMDISLKGVERTCAQEEIVNKGQRHIDTKLAIQLSETKSLLNFKDIDFVLYLAAFSRYLYLLESTPASPGQRINRVPMRNMGMNDAYREIGRMEVVGDNRDELPKSTIIWNIISQLSAISGKIDGQDQFKRVLAFFKDKRIRTAYLEHMHKSLCNLRNAVELYHRRIELERSRGLMKAVEMVKQYRKRYH